MDIETFSAADTVSPVFSFWAALSQLFQKWVLSSEPLLALSGSFSTPIAAGVLAYGLMATILGSRPFPHRLVMVPPGLLLGWYVGGFLSSILGVSPTVLAYGLALLLAALGGYKPHYLAALCVAVVGGIFGHELSAPDETGNADNEALIRVGIIFGSALVTGFLAVLAERVTTAVSVSLLGALATVLASLALLRLFNVELPIARSPYFLQGAIAAVFALGAFLQWRYATTEEERRVERIEKAREQVRAKEERERNKRFETYSRRASGK